MTPRLDVAGCDQWLTAIASGRDLDYVAYEPSDWARREVRRITGRSCPRRVVGHPDMRSLVALTRATLLGRGIHAMRARS